MMERRWDMIAATLRAIARGEPLRNVVRPPAGGLDRYDWLADAAQSPYLIGEYVEVKTVWHPIGA